MKTLVFILCLITCLFQPSLSQAGKDQVYQVVQAYQANDQGQVLGRQPSSGQVVLSANGTYRASLHIQDEGTWKLVKANAQQPRDTILFTSKNKFQFYGYPQQNMMSLWLNRSPQGISQWLTAHLAGPDSAPVKVGPSSGGRLQSQPHVQGNLIAGSVFAAVVLYGTTSSPSSYYWYDPASGEYSEDQKGIIFRPDGTYYLKSEFGGGLMEERGRYAISGNQVRLAFSDGSSLTLTIEQAGRKLHWYSSGMLLTEFFFLGTAK